MGLKRVQFSSRSWLFARVRDAIATLLRADGGDSQNPRPETGRGTEVARATAEILGMRGHLALGCCTALMLPATSLVAQQIVRTSHPQDTLQSGNGNLAPLGVQATGQAAEARTQMLIRASELPGPGAQLVGIEVHAQSDVTLIYRSLQVRVAATQSAALSSTFAANLVAPQLVLQQTGLQVTYAQANWTTVSFSAGYVHDGQSALVLDIQKVIDPATFSLCVMDVPSQPARPELPRMLYAFGGPGSGADQSSSALVAADPLCVRLLWRGVPAMRHRSDRGASGNHYALGSIVSVVVEATPGSTFFVGYDDALLGVPVAVPGVPDLLRISAPIATVGSVDATGVGGFGVAIPLAPLLVGLRVVYQAGVVDVGGAGRWTNTHEHRVNP